MGRLTVVKNNISKVSLFLLVCCLVTGSNAGESPAFTGTEITEQYSGVQKGSWYTTVDSEVPWTHNRIPLEWFGYEDELDETGEYLWEDSDETGLMNSVAISEDGSIVVVGVSLNNNRMIVYDGETGDTLYQFISDLTSEGYIIDISEDGQYIGCTNGQYFHLFTPEVPDPEWTYDAGDGRRTGRLDLSRDGELIVITVYGAEGETNSILAFGPDSNEPIWTAEVDNDESWGWYGVTICADGSTVAANGKFHAYLYDTEDGSLIWDFATNNTESPIKLSADGSVVTTGSLSGGRLRVFHWDNGQEEYVLLWDYAFSGESSNWASATAVSADGSTIAAGSLQFLLAGGYNGYLAVFDTYGDGTPLWVPDEMGDMVSDICISDDGLTITASSWGDMDNLNEDILVYEKYTSEPFFSYSHPGSANDLALTPDGTRLVAGGKAVHNRFFGNGGYAYVFSADLEGGTVSGTITLQGELDNYGVIIEAEDGNRSTVTDAEGNYSLQNVHAGTQTISVHKLGWSSDSIELDIVDGEEIIDIDFTLTPVENPPEGLTASQGMLHEIQLNWDPMTMLATMQRDMDRMITVGDMELDDYPETYDNGTVSIYNHQEETIPELGELDELQSIRIWRSTVSGGPYTEIGLVEADETSYVDDDNIFPTRVYYYVITAVYDEGESVYSNEAIGNLDDTYLVYDPVFPEMTTEVTIDGVLDDGEWDDAVRVDISDVFGYDAPDPPGSAYMYFKYDDENDLLLVAAEDFLNPELDDGEGVGLYVDDDDSDSWTYDRSGSEGNYWAYYYAAGNSLRYRSLSGAPYNSSPYYTFPDAQLEFSDEAGYLTMETAIPMGFHNVYDIALYGPDKTPGVGSFIIERDDVGNAIFHGWWPQNCASIVSNPEQFADASIQATLFVPPVAPTNIDVQRIEESSSLIVSWENPAEGIDFLPLNDFEGMNIYRNGEFIWTVDAEQTDYIDLNPLYGGWYEYSLAGFIDENGPDFEGEFSYPVGAYSGEDPVITQMVYDDSTYEAFYVVSFQWEDNRFAVLMDMPQEEMNDLPTEVYSVQLITNGTDEIGIGVSPNDFGYPLDMVAGPYYINPPVILEFFTFHFPGLERPNIQTTDFWVTIDYTFESPGAPAIGVDTQGMPYNRSMFHTAANGWQPFNFGNLMVRSGVGAEIIAPDDVEDTNISQPYKFNLGNNYPNPFNPATVIPFELPQRAETVLKIYNVVGQEVNTLVRGSQSAGHHLAVWNGKDNYGKSVASGLYFVRLVSGEKTAVNKIMLIK